MFTIILAAVMTIVTWSGTHAAPAVFKHKQEVQYQEMQFAKELCDDTNGPHDCEAKKAWAMKGIKKHESKH